MSQAASKFVIYSRRVSVLLLGSMLTFVITPFLFLLSGSLKNKTAIELMTFVGPEAVYADDGLACCTTCTTAGCAPGSGGAGAACGLGSCAGTASCGGCSAK